MLLLTFTIILILGFLSGIGMAMDDGEGGKPNGFGLVVMTISAASMVGMVMVH